MIVVCFNKMAPRLVEHATSKNNLSKFGESSILQSRLAVVQLPSSCRVLQLKTEIIWLLPLRVGSHNVDLVTPTFFHEIMSCSFTSAATG